MDGGEIEYEDWANHRKLRPAEGHTLGKYLTVSAELARQWGRCFCQLGWDAGPGHVMRIEFPREVVTLLQRLPGDRIDNIGPVYFAPLAALDFADVTEVNL